MARPELIDAARRGDHDAFEALAVAVSGRLYAVARLILRDADLAEDAVQVRSPTCGGVCRPARSGPVRRVELPPRRERLCRRRPELGVACPPRFA